MLYLITRKVTGPSGHGEPGEDILALGHDGVWDIGDLYPAFTTRARALEYIKDHNLYNSGITPIDLNE